MTGLLLFVTAIVTDAQVSINVPEYSCLDLELEEQLLRLKTL
ncbi:MAG: hypothetical protein PUP90_05675 [Nostoc sp. S4]|nr:hypothetical protein [Nostoc sp. S4]